MTAFIVISAVVVYFVGAFISARRYIIDESDSIIRAKLDLDKMTDRDAIRWQRRKIEQDTNVLLIGSVFAGMGWPVFLVIALWFTFVIQPIRNIATRPITKRVEDARALQRAIEEWEEELKKEADPDKYALIQQTIDTLKLNLP